MSENIRSNFHRFEQKAVTEISNFAGRSEFTKIETVAVSTKIPVGDTSRTVSTFNTAFERLQREFVAKVVQDYIAMRSGYVVSYENNMHDNEREKYDRIAESEKKIRRKVETVDYYQQEKLKQKSCMKKFFQSRHD